MRVIFVAAGAAALLAACSTPCPVAPDAAPVVSTYHCDNNADFTATYASRQVAIVQPGFPDVTLPAQESGSGFRYAAEGVELRGIGTEARLTRPGGGEVICRVRTSTSQSSPGTQMSALPGPARTCGANLAVTRPLG